MLKVSKKGVYSMKAIIYIAQSHKELVRISDIAHDENISESLLRRIISDLDKSGIIQTVKGRNGGIKLGKEIQKISTYDILSAIGEELGITDCTKQIECDKQINCTTTDLFGSLQTGFNTLLKMYTLDKIIK